MNVSNQEMCALSCFYISWDVNNLRTQVWLKVKSDGSVWWCVCLWRELGTIPCVDDTQEPNSWSSRQNLVNIIMFTRDIHGDNDDHHKDDDDWDLWISVCRCCLRPAFGVWWTGTRYETCSIERDSIAVGTNTTWSLYTVTQTPVV